jgi:hypothetical protein
MPTALGNRVDKLEAQFPDEPRHPRRFFRFIAHNEDEAEVMAKATTEGYDPDSDDFLIIRWIVSPPER